MIDEKKLDECMLELGHPENQLGAGYIRLGVPLYDAGCRSMTKELYPAIARAADTTPSRVERAIRHSIETAWTRGSREAQYRMFGFSIDPNTGKPTVGEYVARMARLCRTSADAEGLGE